MVFLRLLGFLWCFPVTFLSWVFFFIPSYWKGVFERVYFTKELAIVWDVNNNSKFYKDAMEGWYGFILAANVCVVDVPYREGDWWEKHLKHELVHVTQNFKWGVFFIPVYTACTLFIWLFQHAKHAYLDNPFEREARRAAGQKVDIPPDEWPDGPNDRFPWL